MDENRTSVAEVRPAVLTDLPRMAGLWQEKRVLLQQSDPRFAMTPGERAKWGEAAADWLDDSRCALFVAEYDGRLVGYVVGWLQIGAPMLFQEMGVVAELAIDAHTYHGGLGRKLLQTLLDWFQARGVSHVVAYAPHLHAVEQAFWRALGATPWIDVMWMKP